MLHYHFGLVSRAFVIALSTPNATASLEVQKRHSTIAQGDQPQPKNVEEAVHNPYNLNGESDVYITLRLPQITTEIDLETYKADYDDDNVDATVNAVNQLTSSESPQSSKTATSTEQRTDATEAGKITPVEPVRFHAPLRMSALHFPVSKSKHGSEPHYATMTQGSYTWLFTHNILSVWYQKYWFVIGPLIQFCSWKKDAPGSVAMNLAYWGTARFFHSFKLDSNSL